MIPRRFFWLFDFLILSLTFLAAYSLVPRLAPLFAPGGPLLYQSRTRIVLGSFVAPLAEQDDGPAFKLKARSAAGNRRPLDADGLERQCAEAPILRDNPAVIGVERRVLFGMGEV